MIQIKVVKANSAQKTWKNFTETDCLVLPGSASENQNEGFELQTSYAAPLRPVLPRFPLLPVAMCLIRNQKVSPLVNVGVLQACATNATCFAKEQAERYDFVQWFGGANWLIHCGLRNVNARSDLDRQGSERRRGREGIQRRSKLRV